MTRTTKTPAEVWLEGYEEGLGVRPPRCSGNPYRPDGVPEAVQLYADAQALADVRTLDDAATPESFWRVRPDGPNGAGFRCARVVWCIGERGGAWLSSEYFEGATPDEARAKAAAWARSQK